MATEAQLTKEFKSAVEKIGGKLIVVSGNRGVKGQPDRMLYHRRWCGMVEIKVKKNKLSPHQKMTIERLQAIREWGCVVLRLYQPDDRNAQVIGHIETTEGSVIAYFETVRGLVEWLEAREYGWRGG